MLENLSGPEKVLYKSTYDFSINVLKVSSTEAQENAMQKVLSKRAMAKNFKNFKF